MELDLIEFNNNYLVYTLFFLTLSIFQVVMQSLRYKNYIVGNDKTIFKAGIFGGISAVISQSILGLVFLELGIIVGIIIGLVVTILNLRVVK